jgi:hypothetical protein
MEAFDPQSRSLRDMVWLLRQFEGWRCLWRVLAAAAAFGATWLLPVVGAVAGIYVGSDLKLYRVVFGAIVSLGSTAVAGLFARRKPWRSIFARRLLTYEAPNPRATLEVLIRNEDFIRAHQMLRRNRFVPRYSALLVVPPSDATDLSTRIGVQEPAAWMRSTSDEDRIRRIAAAFDTAGMRARVSGRDVFPGGPVQP